MCGIIGIYGKNDVAKDLYYGLFSLQHRGQESCGIATIGSEITYHKDMGLVSEVFDEEKIKKLQGNIGIGHVRYSTSGGSFAYNSQPLVGFCRGGRIAIAHNGNLINGNLLRTKLEKQGMIFQTSIDSEVILYLIAKNYENSMVEAVAKTMKEIKGAYSLVVMTEDELIAVRDPNGFRPLLLGKRDDEFVVASENASIDILGAEFIRDLEPGEILQIKDFKMETKHIEDSKIRSSCIFEHIYFARNDATIDGINAYKFRVLTGEILAKESPVDADLVIPVPDSGWAGAIGFSKQSGIEFAEGLVKNRYVGRTFIKPTQKEREIGVKIKLNPLKDIVKDKKIVLIDDSIVRGTTSKQLIESLKKAGAKEVHLRITSPAVKYSCYFGIDTPRRSKLIASNHSKEEMKDLIGATSLEFLSFEGLKEAVANRVQICKACFDGNYPVGLVHI